MREVKSYNSTYVTYESMGIKKYRSYEQKKVSNLI